MQHGIGLLIVLLIALLFGVLGLTLTLLDRRSNRFQQLL